LLLRTAAFIIVVGIFMSLPTNGGETVSAQPDFGDLRGADLVLLHGKIWTGEPAEAKNSAAKFAEAVAIANGRILAVGNNAEIQAYAGPNARVVDLKGRLAVPGLIDSHAHFIDGGFQLLSVDLKDARSEEEFIRRIGEKAKTLAPGRWLLGGDWDEQAWAGAKLPTRAMIDAVTARNPVFLSRYDGHAALVNSLALKLAGVTRDTPDPVGGILVRDTQTGEPTGVLKDAAQDLMAKVIPPPTEAEMTEAFRAALGRQGFDHAGDIYAEMRKGNPDFKLNEDTINSWAYSLMFQNHLPEATALLKLNVQMYPESFNVYDSLAEAYMKAGQKDLAIENYRKSLEKNPENTNAIEMLKKLEDGSATPK